MSTFSFDAEDVINKVDISELVNTKVAIIDSICSSVLTTGFTHAVGGIEYHFNFNLDNQTNFANYATSAALSLQLANTDTTTLIASYGANEDGSLNTNNLPTQLPEAWSVRWNGYVDNEVKDLTLGITEFLQLNGAANAHSTSTISKYRDMKAKLRACTTEEEVLTLVEELQLEQLTLTAREEAAKYK